jgi:Tol biopolymer transport system component
VFLPDGKHYLYMAATSRGKRHPLAVRAPNWADVNCSTSNLFMKNSDGTQEEKIIVQDNQDKVPNDWSPDGKYILYAGGTDL